MLNRISKAGEGSFLAVLKNFGDVKSPGMLSFPRPGVTLALDFAFHGKKTLKLLEDIDGLVREVGGAVYPAKDARMSRTSFLRGYPKLDRFVAHLDPLCESEFWKKMNR
jgi:FAD/FMN-containing dehydrogenase